MLSMKNPLGEILSLEKVKSPPPEASTGPSDELIGTISKKA